MNQQKSCTQLRVRTQIRAGVEIPWRDQCVMNRNEAPNPEKCISNCMQT